MMCEAKTNKSISWGWRISKLSLKGGTILSWHFIRRIFWKRTLALMVLWRSCCSCRGSYSAVQKRIFHVCEVFMYANQIPAIFYLMGCNFFFFLIKVALNGVKLWMRGREADYKEPASSSQIEVFPTSGLLLTSWETQFIHLWNEINNSTCFTRLLQQLGEK